MKITKRTLKNMGDPEATSESEFRKLIKLLKPTKNDVFYDLGCGYGNLCLWISSKVKCAVGIERYLPYYNEAIKRTTSCKYPNIKIVKQSFEDTNLKEATIIYSTSLGLSDLRRINKKRNHKTRLIVPIPPYPIKSKKFASFFIMEIPFKRVKDEKEFASICVGKNNATVGQMHKWARIHFEKWVGRNLKWQIQRGNYIWKLVHKN